MPNPATLERLREVEKIEQRIGHTTFEGEMLRLNVAASELGESLAKAFEPLLRAMRLKR